VVNAGMILLVSALLPGFQVRGFAAGILAAVITGVTSWVGHLVVRDGRRL
jgi:putative membrane protein